MDESDYEDEESFLKELNNIRSYFDKNEDYDDFAGRRGYFEHKITNSEYAEKHSEKLAEVEREFEEADKEWDKYLDVFSEKCDKLTAYFEKKGSDVSLPKWALDYSGPIIKSAIKEYKDCLEYEKWDNEFTPKAIRFILKHNGIPTDISNLSKDEYWHYRVLLKKRKSTLLKMLDKYSDVKNNCDYKPFYIASDLTGTEREKLMQENGYRVVPFVHIETGRSGLNLVIKNDKRKESDYHFCLKNLLARKYGGIFEYAVDGQRVDVVFKKNNLSLAIEIETGTNKDIQIERKIDLLRDNFDDFLIVCKREHKKRYRQFVDDVHLATMTEAARHIGEFKKL